MIQFVLHDARDTVAVVVAEGVTAGTPMTGLRHRGFVMTRFCESA